MNLPIFQHLECDARKHCGDCRSSRQWRRDIGQFFELPEGLIDFACPFGVPLVGEATDEKQGNVPPKPAPPQPQHRGLIGKVVHGAIETAKTAVGVGVASEATVAHRKATCEACPSGLYTPCVMGTRHCCGALLTGSGNDMNNPGCGCVIENKIRRAAEACPRGHWGPEEPRKDTA